ncbi:MAG TPA: DUF3806 domain-containing protein [Polyangiaceae bacterium]|jgi:hypothetical protein
MAQTTYPLDGSEWALMREQVATIQALVTRRFGAGTFDHSTHDLEHLQRLLDENVFDETQVDQLRAVGSVFGNVVAKQLGFDWVAESDGRGGRQPALLLKPSGALVVQPQKLIVDRVTRGDAVQLAALMTDIKAQAARTKLLPKIGV